ncbi:MULTISPECIES: hypothetical protein [Mycobacterium]|nr:MULTISPECIES: hypothetical protein [Mycobacterium]
MADVKDRAYTTDLLDALVIGGRAMCTRLPAKTKYARLQSG